MKGICALYGNETELRESHIYPKFVIKHTKKTGSSFLRKLIEPNKRLQDGVKLYLLGDKAEQEFSSREKWFAESIFVPYLSGEKELTYDKSLFYFAVSFLWRILITEIKTDKNLYRKWYYDILKRTNDEWKLFLSKDILPTNFHCFNILFTDRVKKNTTNLQGVDFYTTRVLDATIADNQTQTCLLIYGKFNRFIFWSVLKKYGGEENLSDVKIEPNGGTLKIPQMLDYFPIISLLHDRILLVMNSPFPSDEQQDKIEKEIIKNPEKFWQSDLGKSLFNDKINLD